jgi:hypothetical protein
MKPLDARTFVLPSHWWASHQWHTLVVIAIVVGASHAADTPQKFSGRKLASVLEEVRTNGTRLVYSSALIKPEMTVAAEPAGADLHTKLDAMVQPHGLRAAAGPNETLLIVPESFLRADTGPGVVSFVNVVSDKVDDVSSIEAWKRNFIKPDMTEEQRALAVWKSTVMFRQQESPPHEYVQEACVHDAIKTFNVYGYGMCCCASSNIVQLARAAGLKARGWGITAHSVPEVFFDDDWRLLDASLITYFPGDDGKLLGVSAICDSVADWYGKNPGFKDDEEKLRKFMRNGGWRKGPAALTKTTFYDENGWFPAATHGWYSTMIEYGEKEKTFVYEYGYSQGYQLNVQLRPGERLTRNWFNKGLHVNMDQGKLDRVNAKVGEGDMRYTPRYGDMAPGRIGNGTHEYDVPFASGAWRSGALVAENLAGRPDDLATPAVRVKDAASPGVLVIRMPSSYVYLTGSATLNAVVPAGGGIKVSFSDNHGLRWKELQRIAASGDQTIELSPLVLRRYDYRLKIEMTGKGTGLDALRFVHDVQHSQRALPALGEGTNRIAFSTGAAEGTITLEASAGAPESKKALAYTDFNPMISNLSPELLRVADGRKGEITFPVTTPGEMTRLRFGAHYRARDERDGYDMQVSFDDGKTFKTVDRLAGPTPGHCHYITYSDVPAGTTSAKVRFSGQQRNVTCMFNFRIDADYKEPRGGFRPVKITYAWEENGMAKQDVRIAKQPNENYVINCASKPLMKSITVEVAE